MIDNTVRIDNKGVTLIELIVSIVVGSMVISMLMSVLVMSVRAKATFDADNRMLNESYYISEQIQFNIFDLGPQQLELIEDSVTRTEIRITHLYDVKTDVDNVIYKDYDAPNPIIDYLVYDKVAETITYNGDLIHDSNVFFTTGSAIELIAIDSGTCDLETVGTPCPQGILQLTLNITIQLSGGGFLTPQEFITTIII